MKRSAHRFEKTGGQGQKKASVSLRTLDFAQKSRIKKGMIFYFFSFLLFLPLCNLIGLQVLVEEGYGALTYQMLSEGAHGLLSALLAFLEIVVGFFKSLPLYALLGLGLLSAILFPGERTSLRWLFFAMALLLLIPFVCSLLLAIIFESALDSSDFLYLVLNALVEWAFAWITVGFAFYCVVRARRKEPEGHLPLQTEGQILPQRANRTRWLVFCVVRSAFFVSLFRCILSTLTDLISVGWPQTWGEFFILLYPYLLLTAQAAVGYLLLLWMLQGVEEKFLRS